MGCLSDMTYVDWRMTIDECARASRSRRNLDAQRKPAFEAVGRVDCAADNLNAFAHALQAETATGAIRTDAVVGELENDARRRAKIQANECAAGAGVLADVGQS